MILSPYAGGMTTTRDIEVHLLEVHGLLATKGR